MGEGLPPGFVLREAVDDDAAAVRSVVFSVLAGYGLKPDPEGADLDLFGFQRVDHTPGACRCDLVMECAL